MLMEQYQKAVDDLFAKVRNTQQENIEKAAEVIAEAAMAGKKVYLNQICHGIQGDFIYRGGGPSFYKDYKGSTEENLDRVNPGDVLIVSSVSGRTKKVVDLTWEAVHRGIQVIVFTSMSYATEVEPVHESGKKLYEMATVTLDNCAPAAEAMLHVDGIEAPFTAASGIASCYILWSVTALAVEKMMAKGCTPGIYKSANYPGGADYNHNVVIPHYEQFGW